MALPATSLPEVCTSAGFTTLPLFGKYFYLKCHWNCQYTKGLSCFSWQQGRNLSCWRPLARLILCPFIKLSISFCFEREQTSFRGMHHFYVYLIAPSRERNINTDILHKVKFLDLTTFSPRSVFVALALYQIQCLFKGFFLPLSRSVLFGWLQEYRIFKSSKLHFKIISCNWSLALPKCAQNSLSQYSKRWKPETNREILWAELGRIWSFVLPECLLKRTAGWMLTSASFR